MKMLLASLLIFAPVAFAEKSESSEGPKIIFDCTAQKTGGADSKKSIEISAATLKEDKVGHYKAYETKDSSYQLDVILISDFAHMLLSLTKSDKDHKPLFSAQSVGNLISFAEDYGKDKKPNFSLKCIGRGEK